MTEFINNVNWTAVLAGLVVFEQVVAQVPSLKGNSTIQLVCNTIDAVVSLVKKKGGVA